MSLRNKPEKNDTTFWDQRRGVIRSQKGGWVINEAIHNHGYSMMDDLVGKVSFFQVFFLNIIGKLPAQRLAEWLEAYWICLSWPDARIWCNQVGSLAGSLRTSPVAAVSCGILASDSTRYGPGTTYAATKFIISALKKKKSGLPVGKIISEEQRGRSSSPKIMGYTRPIANGDERIPAMERVTQKLGFEIGEHLSLAYEIEEVLIKQSEEKMNIGGYRCAFLLDQGLTPMEIYRLLSPVVFAGVLACYTEAADSSPESFFPLRCDDINYQGVNSRSVPPPPN
ncbi:citrate synthase [Candidatus Electrothrix aarhusensis]|jgi:citrate synthase|uniref:Citrate synthase n=1 Tax=Candidatus Electrothrix aarhusensis TaxID=1859131 RepID=A0A3S3RRS3_9BACT|nr:citrate synthase [Candidatus Electrothrix aarhusensis]